jgi:hypothetical protein
MQPGRDPEHLCGRQQGSLESAAPIHEAWLREGWLLVAHSDYADPRSRRRISGVKQS